jgi:hypothetical protein
MSDPGKSKYDAIATALNLELGADAVMVLVIGGRFGHGACPALRVTDLARLPQLKADCVRALRILADAMERDEVPPTRKTGAN